MFRKTPDFCRATGSDGAGACLAKTMCEMVRFCHMIRMAAQTPW